MSFAMIRIKFGIVINIIRTDNSGELFNKQCNDLFDAYGITHSSSCVYNPQQNRIVEKKNKHILDTARVLMFQTFTPARYRCECVTNFLCIINGLPTSILNSKSPHELLYKTQPSVGYLRVFGCLYYATTMVKEHMFSARDRPLFLVDYSKTQKVVGCWIFSPNQFVFYMDVIFKEYVFPFATSFVHDSPPKPSMVHDKESILVDPEILQEAKSVVATEETVVKSEIRTK